MTAPAPSFARAAPRLAALAALELPIPPALMCQMIALMDDPLRDAARIAQLVSADPGLAAEALRIVNSAAYGRGVETTDVRTAVVVLGERVMREIIAHRMRNLMGRPVVEGYEMAGEGLWRHAIRTGAAATRLAVPLGVETGTAYTAGLLADIGKLALAHPLAERWSEVEAALLAAPDRAFDDIEREVLGADHARVGAELARSWRLPAPIWRAIAWHHHPSEAPEESRDLTIAVHLADAAAMSIGVAAGSDGLHYALDERALARLGYGPLELERLLIEIERDVAKLEAVLSSGAPCGP